MTDEAGALRARRQARQQVAGQARQPDEGGDGPAHVPGDDQEAEREQRPGALAHAAHALEQQAGSDDTSERERAAQQLRHGRTLAVRAHRLPPIRAGEELSP